MTFLIISDSLISFKIFNKNLIVGIKPLYFLSFTQLTKPIRKTKPVKYFGPVPYVQFLFRLIRVLIIENY